MAELQERLEQLGHDARWPPTPDLAAGVRQAIESSPSPPPRSRFRRRPLLAALLALVVGGGVVAAPGVGSELLQRLGLKGATVTQVRELPPATLGGPLAVGERVSLADAERVVDHDLVRPAALGAPAEVYVDGDAVTFVYRARSRRPILFAQVPGSTRRYVQKLATGRTQRVQVAGRPGLLLRGRHVVIFARPDGDAVVAETRLAKNTLLWERGELLLRLEAEQPAGELLRIARSVG
ncbi:MAG TPA: hypothetical protein VNA28_08910 [Solirubrobacteraceae bacterium]|nr:hypothetical protein [Solirubrobacteraceae bacterium]